jgi:hypothetical protein
MHPAGKVRDQPVAGKVMGLPGGRGSPIERVILAWWSACFAIRPRYALR